MINLEMKRGDDRELEITVSNAAGDGPLDITGMTLRWTLKRAYTDGDADAIAQKSTGGGGISITDGPAGLAEVTVDREDTEEVEIPSAKPLMLFWDLQLTNAGKAQTIAEGRLSLSPDVTRTAP